MTRTKFIVALCIFVVSLSVLAVFFSPDGMIVNAGLRDEYDALVYENERKEAQLDILRDNLERVRSASDSMDSGNDEIVVFFDEGSVTFSNGQVDGQTESKRFEGISVAYLALAALCFSILYLVLSSISDALKSRRRKR